MTSKITKHILFFIPIIMSVFLIIFIGIIGGFLGWKLARITQELYTFPVEKLSTHEFRNGDLLLFCSSIRKWIYSLDAIHMLMSDSPVTHVGIVVQDPHTKLWRCWELALGGNIPELIRLTNLHARVQSFHGTILVRKLKWYGGSVSARSSKEKTQGLRLQLYNHIAKILQNQKKNPKRYRASFYLNTYDRFISFHPPLPMDSSHIPSPSEGNEDSGGGFSASSCLRQEQQREWICTDLVNETYKALDVFHCADYNMWPCDFYSKTEKMPLKANWSFSEEIRLEKDIKI